MNNMQAVVFRGEGRWDLETVPAPRIEADDDVLLEVGCAGICGTDLHILEVPPGHPATPGSILGHEYVATVADVGASVSHLKPGDRVIVDPNITCGVCPPCSLGRTNSCENMTTLGIFRHGGLAALNVAPAKALHKIQHTVPLEQAALVEPLTCVLHAFEKTRLEPGETVAVFGAGPIGLGFLLMFRAAGAGAVCIIEPSAYRRRKAEECGADAVIYPSGDNPVAALQSAFPAGVDVVVDAVGRCLPQALEAVRPGGRVVLFGMDSRASAAIHQFDIARREITIFGSFIQQTAFPKVIRILESGRLPLQKLITHQLGLGEFGRALDLLQSGEAVKVVLDPSGT